MVPSDGELPRGTLDSRLLINLRRGTLEYCVLAVLRHGDVITRGLTELEFELE